jgi:hypothetical protein
LSLFFIWNLKISKYGRQLDEPELEIFDNSVKLPLTTETVSIQDSIMLIREEDWNLDLVQAQFYCIQGPDNDCLPSEFIDLRGTLDLFIANHVISVNRHLSIVIQKYSAPNVNRVKF